MLGSEPRGCIFSHVWPFYEPAVSSPDPQRSMQRPVLLAHSSFIEGSRMTKNMAAGTFTLSSIIYLNLLSSYSGFPPVKLCLGWGVNPGSSISFWIISLLYHWARVAPPPPPFKNIFCLSQIRQDGLKILARLQVEKNPLVFGRILVVDDPENVKKLFWVL